jgi:TRAP-type C4-dicarboxylate transport system permease small subunit
MLKSILKFREWLLKVLELVVIIVTAVLVVDVLWQVFTRYVLRQPSTWTEELATMLLMWVSLLGASVAFHRKGHLGVDYFVNKLSVNRKILADLLVYLFIAFFSVILIYGGYKIVSFTFLTNQRSAALEIRMGYVYLALPISGFFIFVLALETIVIKVNALLRGPKADA